MASISKVLNGGSVWLLYTFRLLQILAIGSSLLGCAKAPPGPPWIVSNSIEVKPLEGWEKLALGRVVFSTTSCCLLTILAYPPSGTRELPAPAAPKSSASTTRSFGEELGGGFAKLLLTPVFFIALPVLVVHQAATSVASAVKPSGRTPVAPAETPLRQTPVAASEQITLRQKYRSWTEEIAVQDLYLAELNASYIEAFKVARRAQADRLAVRASDSEPANRNTAASQGVMIVQLGMNWIRLLVPEDGTMPYITTCALARVAESSRIFETCYSTQLATDDLVAANTETFKTALALHAKKLAEMQATDLTADVQ